MTELDSDITESRILTTDMQATLKAIVLVKLHSPEEGFDLSNIDPGELSAFVARGISMINEFENAAVKPETNPVRTDIDVVWELSGPGGYDNAHDQNDRYQQYPWTRKMDRHRMRKAVTLVHEVTAERMEKPVRSVTSDDILHHGPYLLYNPTPEALGKIQEVFSDLRSQGILKIPPEKMLLSDHFKKADGQEYPIVRTEDQIEGLDLKNIIPRRIALISQPAQLFRALCIMGKFSDRIPKGTIMQPVPASTPASGSLQFAEMEIMGTAARIWGNTRNKGGKASAQPYSYQL